METIMDTHYMRLILASPITSIDTHYFRFYLGTFHEFTIRKNDRGELWPCRAADMSWKEKKACITVSPDVCAGHSCTDLTRAQGADSRLA